MELHELDLNLLVVFNHLLVERRVSKVAEAFWRVRTTTPPVRL